MAAEASDKLLLVTGATGYVGGRLVANLLESGYQVRVLVRDPKRLKGRPWFSRVQKCQGDVMDPGSLVPAMQGVYAAYYMIHSMGSSPDFYNKDIDAARNFGQAASWAGVQRIIYLGGLGDTSAKLSLHLRSRQKTGDALRECGVPVTEFRAAIIVGSGSLSFEMIRNLAERMPVMLTPKWVNTCIQPIGIRNVLRYLTTALEVPESAGKIIDIGGADVLTYGDMIRIYSQVRGLKRKLIPVPFLSPRLSSYWVHLVTPIPVNIARPLIEGLRNEVVVQNGTARELFPHIQLITYEEAVRLALRRIEQGDVETIWYDALASSQGDLQPVVLKQEQGMIFERRVVEVMAQPQHVFQVFSGLGGQRGWLVYNFAWQLRAMLDRLVGGVGFRRGRRHPDELRVGDAVDFWRVEEIEPNRRLRLRAEMKVPGKAWLQFDAIPEGSAKTLLVQTAFFTPVGLSGLAYWYSLYPIHELIFGKLVRRIGAQAEALRLESGKITA